MGMVTSALSSMAPKPISTRSSSNADEKAGRSAAMTTNAVTTPAAIAP